VADCSGFRKASLRLFWLPRATASDLRSEGNRCKHWQTRAVQSRWLVLPVFVERFFTISTLLCMERIRITCSVSGAGKKAIRTKPSSGSASRLGPLWTSKYQPLGSVHTPSPGREFTPSGGAFTRGKVGEEGEDMEGEGLGESRHVLLIFQILLETFGQVQMEDF
jgi:hypothetical protein